MRFARAARILMILMILMRTVHWLRPIARDGCNELLNPIELWLTRLTSDMQQSQESGGADSPEYSLRPAKLIHTLLSFTAISFKVFNKNMSRKLLNNSPFDVGTTICILHFTWIS